MKIIKCKLCNNKLDSRNKIGYCKSCMLSNSDLHPMFRDAKIIGICPICNEEFKYYKCSVPRKYCSKEYRKKGNKPSSKCLICGKNLYNRRSKRCKKHAIEFINQNNKNLSLIRSINCKKQHKLGILNSKGKNNPMSGKIIHGKYQKYGSIGMRSGFEVAFAKWCDKNNIKWLYESKTFDLGNTTYTPDFYLPEFNLWIEVKGWWRDDARQKFDLFRQIYCGERIKILDKNELKLGGVL